jgi:hypothetical protein
VAVYKVLGQAAPAATTNTDLYTVPAATQTVVSTLTVANRAASNTTFRLAVRPAGAALADQHYLAYDTALTANTTATLTLGLSLAATDVLTVYAGSVNVTFAAFGVENP